MLRWQQHFDASDKKIMPYLFVCTMPADKNSTGDRSAACFIKHGVAGILPVHLVMTADIEKNDLLFSDQQGQGDAVGIG